MLPHEYINRQTSTFLSTLLCTALLLTLFIPLSNLQKWVQLLSVKIKIPREKPNPPIRVTENLIAVIIVIIFILRYEHKRWHSQSVKLLVELLEKKVTQQEKNTAMLTQMIVAKIDELTEKRSREELNVSKSEIPLQPNVDTLKSSSSASKTTVTAGSCSSLNSDQHKSSASLKTSSSNSSRKQRSSTPGVGSTSSAASKQKKPSLRASSGSSLEKKRFVVPMRPLSDPITSYRKLSVPSRASSVTTETRQVTWDISKNKEREYIPTSPCKSRSPSARREFPK